MRLSGFICIFVFALSSLAWAHEDLNKNQSVFQLEAVWTDQNGKPRKLKDFHGKPLILAMVYTSCQGACPLIVSDIQKIAGALSEDLREKIQYALFSFDPNRDTSSQLKKFADAHGLSKKNWTLLTSSPKAVRELAAVLGIKYRKDSSGGFAHSNVITILDSDGVVRHQQSGLKQDPHISAQIISALFLKKGN